MLRARLVYNLSSLNFHYSIFITYHSSLKISQFLKHAARFHQKEKICLSNIAVRYMGLIMKMSLKTEFWKLKTLKMCFQFS